MKNLWAPWRMDYINELREPGNCFLCEAGASSEDRDNLVFYRGTDCFAILNRYPYNNGHALIAPLAHKADLEDLSSEETLELMRMTTRVKGALQEIMSPQGFNIGINLGTVAGAGVPGHLHIHIVPRWQGDTNFMPVVGQTKVIPQSLDAVYNRLAETLRPRKTK